MGMQGEADGEEEEEGEGEVDAVAEGGEGVGPCGAGHDEAGREGGRGGRAQQARAGEAHACYIAVGEGDTQQTTCTISPTVLIRGTCTSTTHPNPTHRSHWPRGPWADVERGGRLHVCAVLYSSTRGRHPGMEACACTRTGVPGMFRYAWRVCMHGMRKLATTWADGQPRAHVCCIQLS